MQEYTEKIHRKRLVKMLQKKEPCGCCPAAPRFRSNKSPKEMWKDNPCEICVRFIDKDALYTNSCWFFGHNKNCPCNKYGREKAIELTIKALKKKGDL